VLAALLSRVVPMPGALLVLLLAVSCGAVSLGAALIAEISVRVGAGGGAFAAALVAPVLGLTIAAAPLAPGAQRPGLADLLWLPLVGLLAALTLRGGAGWLGARAGCASCAAGLLEIRWKLRQRRDVLDVVLDDEARFRVLHDSFHPIH
jgi:hypothetical protein